MGHWCEAHNVKIRACCLLPNDVHLIAVPQTSDGLRRAIGEVHRRYTRMVNFREGWRGHLWQGRFASFVLDEPYLRRFLPRSNKIWAGSFDGRNPHRSEGHGVTYGVPRTGLTPQPSSWRMRFRHRRRGRGLA
jgi:Transposase IS200 like